jgi:hypothetical protein
MTSHSNKHSKHSEKKQEKEQQQRAQEDIKNLVHNEQVLREAGQHPEVIEKVQREQLTQSQIHQNAIHQANEDNQNRVIHQKHGVDIDHSNKVSSAESAHQQNPRQQLDKQDLDQSKKDILQAETMRASDADVHKHGFRDKKRPNNA